MLLPSHRYIRFVGPQPLKCIRLCNRFYIFYLRYSDNTFIIRGQCKLLAGHFVELFCRNVHSIHTFNFFLQVMYVKKLDIASPFINPFKFTRRMNISVNLVSSKLGKHRHSIWNGICESDCLGNEHWLNLYIRVKIFLKV